MFPLSAAADATHFFWPGNPICLIFHQQRMREKSKSRPLSRFSDAEAARRTFNGGFTLTRRDKKVQLHDSLGRGYGKAFSSMRESSQRRGHGSFLFAHCVFLQSAGVGGGDQEKQPAAFCTCRNVAGWHLAIGFCFLFRER